jgi:hypothetical protein
LEPSYLVFRKTRFINPPEVRGQAVDFLIHGKGNGDAKVSKSTILGNNQIAEIGITMTLTCRVFLYSILYSILHLEPDHASMLAEWFDVGQSNYP